MASMLEFLTSGRLGEVQLGAGLEKLTDILGEPDDRSVRRRPISILRYGAVEFAFQPIGGSGDSTLASIAVYFDRPDRGIHGVLRPTDWLPTRDTSQEEFSSFLVSSGIRAESTAGGHEESLILFPGGSAAFSEGRLHSIHVRASEKRRKQMTVSLPHDTVEMLRKRAKEEHVSVHDLVERMIRAGA
jgi:hypothetical protein